MNLDRLNPAVASRKAQDAINHLALSAGVNARGAVFPRQEVVDFILDLTGDKEDQPLPEKRRLEPSFGAGKSKTLRSRVFLARGERVNQLLISYF